MINSKSNSFISLYYSVVLQSPWVVLHRPMPYGCCWPISPVPPVSKSSRFFFCASLDAFQFCKNSRAVEVISFPSNTATNKIDRSYVTSKHYHQHKHIRYMVCSSRLSWAKSRRVFCLKMFSKLSRITNAKCDSYNGYPKHRQQASTGERAFTKSSI